MKSRISSWPLLPILLLAFTLPAWANVRDAIYSQPVWKVTRQWEAVEAGTGLGWPASSGLNWHQKFAKWVDSLPKVKSSDGNYWTYKLTTPYGKEVVAPVLECAESAMFLRAVFASWHGLPFMMQVGPNSFLGHFGWVEGGAAKTFKSCSPLICDYSGRTSEQLRTNWPKDNLLRTKKLAGANDDFQPAIGQNARFGAYLDELLANKRVGYFIIALLDWAGSMNIAGSTNTYDIKPEAIQPGDMLVERWQKTGIGHVLVVKRVKPVAGGKLEVDLVWGSMPRQQPEWKGSVMAKSYLTTQYTGGSQLVWGTNYTYAHLGGGLKRWRPPKLVGGIWRLYTMNSDAQNVIPGGDWGRLGARPKTFESLIAIPDPAQLREELLTAIEQAREHLRTRNPYSCNARTRREELFAQLYDINSQNFAMSKLDTDKKHRKTEDYIFVPLDYARSPTCCADATAPAMAALIVEFGKAAAMQGGTCRLPPVFKMTAGDYPEFRRYAVQTGHIGDWKSWSNDENCRYRDMKNDVVLQLGANPYCTIRPSLQD
jgi:hypothetical protein